MKFTYEENPYYVEPDSQGRYIVTSKLGHVPSILDKPFEKLFDAIREIKDYLRREDNKPVYWR